jgi:hypothetical protein
VRWLPPAGHSVMEREMDGDEPAIAEFTGA